MRVLITADAVGGVWRYSIDLIQELTRRGANVLLATLGPRPSEEQKEEALEISGVTLVQGNFALEWMSDPWADVDTAGDWLLDLAVDFAPDIVHLNGYAHAALNWPKPVIVVAHSCVFSWWRTVHGCAPGPEWNEYRRRVTGGLAAADAIVAPSEFMATALKGEYGVSSSRINVIHNFSYARPRWMQKEAFILAAGRIWDEAKNVALLNSIAPGIDWNVRVAGSARSPASSAAPDNMAHFLGPLARGAMLDQLDRAAIFAHPAVYEPFGLSVLEAASAGCCLVLSDIPSLRELWDGAAVFLSPRDADAWLTGLNALIRDSLTRQRLGERAYLRASKYRPDQSVTRYWDLYVSLSIAPRKARKEVAA